jgi:hypothetical protein
VHPLIKSPNSPSVKLERSEVTALPYRQKTSIQPLNGRELGEIAIDVAGPFRTAAMDHFCYHQTMVLSKTTKLKRYALMSYRSIATQLVIEFYQNLERQTGTK